MYPTRTSSSTCDTSRCANIYAPQASSMNLVRGLEGEGGVKYKISEWNAKTSLDMDEEPGNTTNLHNKQETTISVKKQRLLLLNVSSIVKTDAASIYMLRYLLWLLLSLLLSKSSTIFVTFPGGHVCVCFQVCQCLRRWVLSTACPRHTGRDGLHYPLHPQGTNFAIRPLAAPNVSGGGLPELVPVVVVV